ncbi:hypothetical protein [Kitasatospora sp. NPDC088134]|uniref:hypothetical protein n=1 Tax=Kitasatospora sp. NPDC088134 TaxID=3364071 RepID=UPI00381D479E
MTELPTDRTAMFRRGAQELLDSRAMETDPAGLAPPPQHGGMEETRGGPHFGDAAFSHGGRRAPTASGPADGPAVHTELPGHRHRGAERHSAH